MIRYPKFSTEQSDYVLKLNHNWLGKTLHDVKEMLEHLCSRVILLLNNLVTEAEPLNRAVRVFSLLQAF